MWIIMMKIAEIAYKPLLCSLSCLNIYVDVVLIPPIIVHLCSVIGLHVKGTFLRAR